MVPTPSTLTSVRSNRRSRGGRVFRFGYKATTDVWSFGVYAVVNSMLAQAHRMMMALSLLRMKDCILTTLSTKNGWLMEYLEIFRAGKSVNNLDPICLNYKQENTKANACQ